jgi:hypothetical protein
MTRKTLASSRDGSDSSLAASATSANPSTAGIIALTKLTLVLLSIVVELASRDLECTVVGFGLRSDPSILPAITKLLLKEDSGGSQSQNSGEGNHDAHGYCFELNQNDSQRVDPELGVVTFSSAWLTRQLADFIFPFKSFTFFKYSSILLTP